jgi:hypothetical protein
MLFAVFLHELARSLPKMLTMDPSAAFCRRSP